jgi:hypothetical protein
MVLPRRVEAAEACDLHALTVEQAMHKFVRQYNKLIAAGRAQPLDVVHGFNQGIEIQRPLRTFLTEHTDEVSFVTGESLDDNPGHTKVYPNKLLPQWEQSLPSRILAFCSNPKPRERIQSQFAKHGELRVREAVDGLIRSGRLKPIAKNGKNCLVASAAANTS